MCCFQPSILKRQKGQEYFYGLFLHHEKKFHKITIYLFGSAILSHDDKPGGSKETTSNSELNSNENMEIDNNMTEKKQLNQGDNIPQVNLTKDVVRESNISSTQSRENSNCYYEDFDNGEGFQVL